MSVESLYTIGDTPTSSVNSNSAHNTMNYTQFSTGLNSIQSQFKFDAPMLARVNQVKQEDHHPLVYFPTQNQQVSPVSKLRNVELSPVASLSNPSYRPVPVIKTTQYHPIEMEYQPGPIVPHNIQPHAYPVSFFPPAPNDPAILIPQSTETPVHSSDGYLRSAMTPSDAEPIDPNPRKRVRTTPPSQIKKYHDLERDSITKLPIFPCNLGAITLEAIGIIDHRPLYHNKRYIFPIGFQTSRYY